MKTPHTILAAITALASDPHTQPEFTAKLDAIAKDMQSILPKTEADRFDGIPEQTIVDLKKRFTYHAPKPGQPEIYGELRGLGMDLAILIVRHVPAGREQSSALTKVEEAIFWANAGVARHG